MRPPRCPQRASVALVALCFVAVIGISLASYLAISNQAMKLSNRSFRTGVSEQLAESGLEEALRAFNKNDWSNWASGGTSASWNTSGTSANCTITFPASKFGQGVTGSLKIRVDNYNAANLSATWSSTANYRINDLVGSGGIWYRSVQNGNLNNNPSAQTNLTWWVPAPVPWAWCSNTTYTANYSVVCNGGAWYRCITTNINQAPPNANWSVIPAPSLAWNNSTNYAAGTFVYSGGTWYRCVSSGNTGLVPPNAHWSTGSPYISWSWQTSHAYAFNDVVLYPSPGMGSTATWYRCITPHTSSGAILPTNASYWENALSGSWAWASTSAYNLNDVVYSGGSFYRCILAHTNHTPPNATYWSTAPPLSIAWDAGRQYSTNDTVSYEGVWYRSLQNSNFGQNPVTATTYWQSTANAATQWNAVTSYSVGNYCSYGGVWYKCLSAGTNNSPNNSTYWSASWLNSSGAATGAPVIYAEGSATLPDGSATIKTQLRATIAPAPLFPNALAANTTLQIGGGGTIDSYDFNTGPYASQVGTSTNYSAVLAAGGTVGTAITISSTAVNGYVAAPSSASAPYAPLFSSGGSVKGFSSPGAPNIDLTRLSRSPYIPQFGILPAGGLAAAFGASNFAKGTLLTLSPTAPNTEIGTPGAPTPSRYYYNGDLDLSGSTSLLNINGPVILFINGDLIMDGGTPNGLITINNTGSAEIHIAGSLTVNIAADGINNTTLDPKKLILICDTAASSSQNYSDGTSPVYGVIYLPNTTNASGLLIDNPNVLIYGAISANKINYSGVNANLHYDTSLRYATFGGIDTPYTVMEWRELTDPAEKATLP